MVNNKYIAVNNVKSAKEKMSRPIVNDGQMVDLGILGHVLQVDFPLEDNPHLLETSPFCNSLLPYQVLLKKQ